ncbi:MAG TPA: bifunctional [glutamate--ammonia ligase]-adenylyl-L-tyrosine phosphorylase/[glutamate--ammonia-ligase] adenylyltransferase [Pirellulales bacterium]
METVLLQQRLEDPKSAPSWLAEWGVANPARAHENLVRIARRRIPIDLMGSLCEQFSRLLPACPDPDMALNNVERYFAVASNPLSVAASFERDHQALPILIQIFSTSQYFSDLLVADQGAFDVLRLTEGQPVSRESLIHELWTEILALSTPTSVSAAIRRFKRRETLRIGYGDIVRGQKLETVTSQISYLADAVVEAAVRAARMNNEQKYGTPQRHDKQPARYVVLALGKLGGEELNYSSDVDLVCLYDGEGVTNTSRKTPNNEFFERVTRDVVKVLSEVTDLGQGYRVDLRLRPEGSRGPLVRSLDDTLQYYDVVGRTWERQAYVKARPIAGDLDLGREFLAKLEPWVYRRYLSLADIVGIKALKRRIERMSELEGDDLRNVKTGRGGIRDVEFVIQFLQLLNGGDLPPVRTGNTLAALAALEEAGCLTDQERALLETNYRFLRKIEHRLQFMFDLQTHVLPADPLELKRLAIRLGYKDGEKKTALAAFQEEFDNATQLNRKILDHLLHDAFPDDPETEPETDLVLDPDPSPERIQQVLGKYRFEDVPKAYQLLVKLATEDNRFLSPRRCRLFLASIARRMLEAIADTPDPDQTLVNLEKVSASLGGKSVLWELFRFNEATLRLYVDLCCFSPMLNEILVTNPGMIDELLDSLVLNKLPTLSELRRDLAELCRAAEDINPILYSFKNSNYLRIGVRDVLDKAPIEEVTGALSDLAEACLERIVDAESAKLIAKYGQPTIAEGPRQGQPCRLIILAMGKWGGGELSYYSDLDVIFLYESDGHTQQPPRARRTETTTNSHFFGELGQRIIKAAGQLGPFGRLYEIDARLRPTGRSGALATSLAGFERHFSEGGAPLWERQSLCKARVLFAPPDLAETVQTAIHAASFGRPWQPEDAGTIHEMRVKLDKAASPRSLKRGRGGIVDIEFVVQMLQLAHAGENPALRIPNTIAALDALHAASLLTDDDWRAFRAAYLDFRRIEARLRLMNPNARHEVPEDPEQLDQLGRRLGFPDGESFKAHTSDLVKHVRERFERLFAGASVSSR